MNYLDALTPYTKDTTLVNFMPVPKYLFAMELSSTAILLYVHLLNRASLSKENGWHNRDGWLYVIFTVPDLARALHKGRSTIQKLLVELEEKGLVIRSHPVPGEPTNYFLRIPAASAVPEEEPCFSSFSEKIGPALKMEEGWHKFQWGRHQKSDPNKLRE